MAQALSDIYNSLSAAYNPQRDLYNQQLGTVDQQTQGAVAGLNQQEQNAFSDIKNNANSNGMYYSGVTPHEEQKYVGGTFLPGLADLQNQAQNQKYGLQQALAGVGVNQTNQANSIYQTQVGQDQQQNYYNQQLAMQNAQNQYMRGLYGGGGGGGAAAPNANAVLASAFDGYNPSVQGRQANYTEQQLAPKISAALGIPYAQALQQAYQYRKQVYNQ